MNHEEPHAELFFNRLAADAISNYTAEIASTAGELRQPSPK